MDNDNEGNSKEGIVYVMTNVAMPDYIKIGKAGATKEKLLERKKGLYNTNIPIPFEIYYAVAVSDVFAAEKLLHDAFAMHRDNPNREFFHDIDPERVKSAMQLLLMNGGKEIPLTEADSADIPDEDKYAQEKAKARLGKRFDFSEFGIEKGSELKFTKDPNQIVVVFDRKHVYFKSDVTDNPKPDDLMSVSAAAFLAFEKSGNPISYKVNGTSFWEYHDETLYDIRSQKHLDGGE